MTETGNAKTFLYNGNYEVIVIITEDSYDVWFGHVGAFTRNHLIRIPSQAYTWEQAIQCITWTLDAKRLKHRKGD